MKTLFFRIKLVSWPLLMALGSYLYAPMTNAEKADVSAEVLVFVDVSGSMVKNDPNNMRSPAIRLLAGMAPENVRAGIYLFGTQVRELVPPEIMNRHWKAKAEKKSRSFRSRDMYTNIEAALLTANKNWMERGTSKRSVILLTDGIVDIDKKKSVSDASRERVLTSVLEQLKSNNVSVHTMALSENADHELLETLSLNTDGHYQKVNKADDLQRTFMRLFEQSAPQDTLPLQGNGFSVDSSISELTLLIFRKEGAEPTQVITPEGEIYYKGYAVDGLNWKHDAGYDLVSISHPLPGEWRIVADEDPDNRAMIVTDLKLNTNELPGNILNGEKLSWTAWLEERGKVVTKPEFLKLLSAHVKTTDNSIEQQSWELGVANLEGQFILTMGPEWQEGSYELLLTIDSGTFVREKRLSIMAHGKPIDIKLELMDEGSFEDALALKDDKKKMPRNILSPEDHFEPTQGWQVMIKGRNNLIDLDASEVTVDVESQTGLIEHLVAERNDEGWSVSFIPSEAGQNIMSVKLDGKTATGRDINTSVEKIELGQSITLEEETSSNLIPTMKEFLIPIIIGNIFFILLFFGWKQLKRMRENAMLHPEEAL